MDAINAQLFTMDIEELARPYKGKVTFRGEMDRQQVLPFGTPAEVRAAVHRVRRALDDGRGVLIAQCEWGKDNPKENIETVSGSGCDPARRKDIGKVLQSGGSAECETILREQPLPIPVLR